MVLLLRDCMQSVPIFLCPGLRISGVAKSFFFQLRKQISKDKPLPLKYFDREVMAIFYQSNNDVDTVGHTLNQACADHYLRRYDYRRFGHDVSISWIMTLVAVLILRVHGLCSLIIKGLRIFYGTTTFWGGQRPCGRTYGGIDRKSLQRGRKAVGNLMTHDKLYDSAGDHSSYRA
jgi:hypothetical protein